MMSVLPPAEKPTIRWTGRAGYGAGAAIALHVEAAIAAAPSFRSVRRRSMAALDYQRSRWSLEISLSAVAAAIIDHDMKTFAAGDRERSLREQMQNTRGSSENSRTRAARRVPLVSSCSTAKRGSSVH
jgi:hypothetical protein